MDSDNDALMREASDLFEKGDKQQAMSLLAQVIQSDPNNAKAWYAMALCVDDVEKKKYCLLKALELKPGNKAITQELQKISSKPKPQNKSFVIILAIIIFLCVGSLLSCAVLSYVGFLPQMGNQKAASNQGVSITATLDPAMLSYIVETQYASAVQGYPTAVLDPTATPSIIDNPTPILNLVPVIAPTQMAIPTLSIVANENSSCVPQNERVSGTVTTIIDGDTIKVAIGETAFTVRYIGIDSPEETSAQDIHGMEATQKNKDLVLGKKVILIKDVSETDQYGRLLRYVFVDNIFVNYELVAQGHATAMTYEPDTACMGTFLYAEQSARNAQIGLWAPVEIAIPTVSKSNNIDCDPAYPDVCIKSPPPDLNCGDIPFKKFKVLPPDPHDLDGNDNDGIGCEK